jgi:ParB family chromosome partitioning protein
VAEDKKGLNYIFGDDLKRELTEIEKSKKNVEEISLSLIKSNPYSPRRVFDEEKLIALSQSIKKDGLLFPIIIRPTGELYEIVSGERRLRACKIAGRLTIFAIVGEYTDEQMLSLALEDNLQKEKLSAIEEGMLYKHIIDKTDIDTQTLANKIGKSRSYISNSIRLLQFSPNAQEKIIKYNLTIGQVRPLLGLTDKQIQLCLDLIIEHNLNARDCEKLGKDVKNGFPPSILPSVSEADLNEKYDCIARIRGIKLEMIFDKQEDLLHVVAVLLGKTVENNG